ncbi:MAG: efflux RND transporter periplasmic adaptor subunit [Patescibacteria group bacterium]
MFNFLRKRKRVKKHHIILFALIVVVIIGGAALANREEAPQEDVAPIIPTVTISKVGELDQDSTVNATGVVKAATQVDVVALVNGTVQSIGAQVGDIVAKDTALANLYDATVLTNLSNAVTNYNNINLSFDTTKRLADESVRQAELNVQNAGESVQSAEVALQAAEDSLTNTSALQAREVENVRTSAVISIDGYLNTSANTLEQINYILKVEGNDQLPGIGPVLGAKDPLSVQTAEDAYTISRAEVVRLRTLENSDANVEVLLPQVVANLKQTLAAVNALTVVLENTVSSNLFTDSALLAQKNTFATLRANVVASNASAEGTLQTIQNQPLVHKQQIDALTAGVESARNQLDLAKLGLSNAEISLLQAEQSRDSQVIGASTSLDTSRGQLSLAQSQANDLSISAPIDGQIIAKHIEVGGEVGVGTKLFTIAQSDLVKVLIEVTSDEVYQLKVGQKVVINEEFDGVISQIDPTADSVSRKVGVEIIFNNAQKELIPETFVDVSIPLDDVVDSTITIPLRAVTITQTERFVMVVEDNKAIKREVVIGQIIGADIEVVSGLDSEDILIIEGNKQVSDGQEVTTR